MNFRLGELFCGAGGLAWGAFHASEYASLSPSGETFEITHAWANDLDESACRTYALNHLLTGQESHEQVDRHIIAVSEWKKRVCEELAVEVPSVICGNVEELTAFAGRLPDIDAFAFGFPCNDFSAVGERKGLNGDFGPLYKHGIKVLNVKRPRWFVAENVEGLIHRSKGSIYDQIVKEMAEAGPGYVLTEHIYRFEEYGVPQQRARLVIVGISQEDAASGVEFHVPAPTTVNNYHSAGWALLHDPEYPEVEKPLVDGDTNHKIKIPVERVRKRLEHTQPGENAWTAALPPDVALKVKAAHLSMIYRRLEANKPAYTITGNGGGGTHGYHWEEPRALTNRERARLQSFPDRFVFTGNEGSVRKQIGMAVPPIASREIFAAILKSYAGIEYDWVPADIGSSLSRRQKQTNDLNPPAPSLF